MLTDLLVRQTFPKPEATFMKRILPHGAAAVLNPGTTLTPVDNTVHYTPYPSYTSILYILHRWKNCWDRCKNAAFWWMRYCVCTNCNHLQAFLQANLFTLNWALFFFLSYLQTYTPEFKYTSPQTAKSMKRRFLSYSCFMSAACSSQFSYHLWWQVGQCWTVGTTDGGEAQPMGNLL